MPDSSQNASLLASTLSQIAKENPISASEPQAAQNAEFFIFYSFDLANSTQFKTRHPQDWPFQTRTFFDVVQQAMDEEFNILPKEVTVKLWKFAGDEVLFYQKVTKASDCDYAIPIARRVLDRSIQEVQKEENARELLSVKATVWCARTVHFSPGTTRGDSAFDLGEHEGQCRNLIIKDSNGNLDFLGPEVDAGFRVAKIATRDRLLVSADLSYLYYRRNQHMGRIMDKYGLEDKPTELMKVVCYDRLKGVWNERNYPVIWFEHNWESIDETFHYDDETNQEVLGRIVQRVTRERKIEGLSCLENVYRNRGQYERMERFVREVESLDSPNEDVKQPKVSRAELHCVPVCVSSDFDKVLIAKRPPTKNLLPSYWEFGCGQLDEGQTIEECLSQTCREDFGVEINLTFGPVPLGVFSFSREQQNQEQKRVPGVTFAVLCQPDSQPQNKKHADVRWIGLDELETFVEDRVTDFDSTVPLALKRAKEQWRSPNESHISS